MPDPEQSTTIRRGVTRLARRLRHERPPSALSANKIAVLAHLHRNGPATPGAIAAAEHQQPQSLTRVFADLEADGLIVRVRSATDRRAWVLHLTDPGRTALGLGEVLERGLLEVAARLMDRLADQDSSTPGAGNASVAPRESTDILG